MNVVGVIIRLLVRVISTRIWVDHVGRKYFCGEC